MVFRCHLSPVGEQIWLRQRPWKSTEEAFMPDAFGPRVTGKYRLEWTDEDGEPATSPPMSRWKAEVIREGLLDDLGIDSEIVED